MPRPKSKKQSCYQRVFAYNMRKHYTGKLHRKGGKRPKSLAQAKAIAHSKAQKECVVTVKRKRK